MKNISRIGHLPQIGMKIKHIWNHHLDIISEAGSSRSFASWIFTSSNLTFGEEVKAELHPNNMRTISSFTWMATPQKTLMVFSSWILFSLWLMTSRSLIQRRYCWCKQTCIIISWKRLKPWRIHCSNSIPAPTTEILLDFYPSALGFHSLNILFQPHQWLAETSLSNEGAPIPLLPSTLLDPKEPQIKQWIFVAQQEIW